jgi:predicted kinase
MKIYSEFIVEEIEYYEITLSYLINEGYAETLEHAEDIYLNLDEASKNTIGKLAWKATKAGANLAWKGVKAATKAVRDYGSYYPVGSKRRAVSDTIDKVHQATLSDAEKRKRRNAIHRARNTRRGREELEARQKKSQEVSDRWHEQKRKKQEERRARTGRYRNVGAGSRESVREMKTYSEFIVEASRKSQRASKAGRIPKEGLRSKESQEKPTAHVTVGLPGSGKSTIAKHMVSKGKTDQHELDKSRKALGKGPAHFGSDIVKHTYDGAKKSAKRGRNTVLSNTSIPKQHRQDAIDKLKDSGYDKVTPVLAPGSTKAAMRRNRKRTGSKPGEGAVPQFVMNRMAQGMKGISRKDKRELRGNYKKLHKKERFTKPAMKRSGAIK